MRKTPENPNYIPEDVESMDISAQTPDTDRTPERPVAETAADRIIDTPDDPEPLSNLSAEQLQATAISVARKSPESFRKNRDILAESMTADQRFDVAKDWLGEKGTKENLAEAIGTFGLTTEQTRTLLSELPEAEWPEALNGCGFDESDPENEVTVHTGPEGEAYERELTPEQKERLEKWDRIYDNMSEALIKTYPDKALEVSALFDRAKQMREAKFLKTKPLGGGVSAPRLALMEGLDSLAVLKGKKEGELEPDQQELDVCRARGVDYEQTGDNEVLAFLCATAVMAGAERRASRIPVTVPAAGPGVEGSLAEFEFSMKDYWHWTELPDGEFGTRQIVGEAYENESMRRFLMETAVVDDMMNNSDRRIPNMGEIPSDPDKTQGILFDHGLVLGSGRNEGDLGSVAVQAIHTIERKRQGLPPLNMFEPGALETRTPLDDDLTESAWLFLGSTEARKALKDAFDLTLRRKPKEDRDKTFDEFIGRVEDLTKEGIRQNGILWYGQYRAEVRDSLGGKEAEG